MYCEIILVQHALTQWNVDRRCQGHTDTPLNGTGRKMAHLLAERLKDEEVAVIYTSDLRRAYETAGPFLSMKPLLIYKDERLREGRWKNQEQAGEYPVLPFYVDFEESHDVSDRAVAVLNEIAKKHPKQRVLVISHSGIINRFIGYVRENTQQVFPEYKRIKTAINRFVYQDGKWSCIRLNDDAHLAQLNRVDLSKDNG